MTPRDQIRDRVDVLLREFKDRTMEFEELVADLAPAEEYTDKLLQKIAARNAEVDHLQAQVTELQERMSQMVMSAPHRLIGEFMQTLTKEEAAFAVNSRDLYITRLLQEIADAVYSTATAKPDTFNVVLPNAESTAARRERLAAEAAFAYALTRVAYILELIFFIVGLNRQKLFQALHTARMTALRAELPRAERESIEREAIKATLAQ